MHTCFHLDLAEGMQSLSDDEALHVARVLRMKAGESIRLVNGHGAEALGRLVEVGKRKVDVEVDEVRREERRPSGLILVVAPTKHTDRFEWLLEKATELGVEEVVPVWTQRSERKTEKHDRWDKVLVAATKQCQRLWKPTLHPACDLNELHARIPSLKDRPGAVAHCMDQVEGVPTRVAWTSWLKDKPSAWLAIGPEGDFSAGEVRGLVQMGAAAVHLGELRLRTETAGIAAVAQFGSSL
ncbi:MAG: RsmE family RNA methyltransferase [Flavobacteriales bacterium]